jgi:hypothetical protein
MRRLICLAAGLAVLSGCDRVADRGGARPGPAFHHAATADISGYYVPAGTVRIGDWSLDHVFIGQTSAFERWEDGPDGEALAPVMIRFAAVDATEPGEADSAAVRVLPDRYAVTDSAIRFEGRSPRLGRVVFDGRLDAGALATSRRNLGGDGAVLTGTLTAGGQTVPNVRLRWWMGD